MFRKLFFLWVLVMVPGLFAQPAGTIVEGYHFGYLTTGAENVASTYSDGYSMYVPVWPLMKDYPGKSFQSGLIHTWLGPVHTENLTENVYTKIEGGLGWWRDTEYATTTPKFIMGGVGPDFSLIVNGPGDGIGTWEEPRGHYGVAQLSNRLLWPPDGLNLKQGMRGEMFGYGYLPLPLTDAKATTKGVDVPTGDQSWTLFLNTKHFKGPATCIMPYFWSRAALDNELLAGELFDTRPADPNIGAAMENQNMPIAMGFDHAGNQYARLAVAYFPRNLGEDSVLAHQISAYDRNAIWNDLKSWFQGGSPVPAGISESGTAIRPSKNDYYSSYEFRFPGYDNHRIDFHSYTSNRLFDDYTFGLSWDFEPETAYDPSLPNLVQLPEYYRLRSTDLEWVPIHENEVPAETGLLEYEFTRVFHQPKYFTTPDSVNSSWKDPGPVAGPFKAYPGDGSVVTYYWYRFADQPTLLNADLSLQEREAMQARVELLHTNWKTDQNHLKTPELPIELADLDPALIVSPPNGLGVGYVPIATAQSPLQSEMEQVAVAGETVTFNSPVHVAFGANGRFLYKYNVTGSVTFSPEDFGDDPAPGILKYGYVMLVPGTEAPEGYFWCANENETYTFAETVDVAFGANGQFEFHSDVSGAVTFDTATFGDPVPGTPKRGYYRIAESQSSDHQLTVINGSGSGSYSPGSTRMITAATPPVGQEFDRWLVTGYPVIGDLSSASTTIIMPDWPVTVEATYLPILTPLPVPTLETEIFSVNFYGYGGLSISERSAVTLEASESAGVGPWKVNGWRNIAMPWHPNSPQAPVTIMGSKGSTATFVLNDVRNGGPRVWNQPHAGWPSNGDADMMDGHANGSLEDPADTSNIFEMSVSDLPEGSYGLLLYLGSNRDQYGSGTAKLVLDDGPERSFVLSSGSFLTFQRIHNSTTPGNYVLLEGISGEFNLKVWGDGFNHIGPCGFQLFNMPVQQNQEPSAEDQLVTLRPNTEKEITLTGSDPEGEPLSYFIVDPPQHGILEGDGANRTYTPDPGFVGSDSFTFRVNDGLLSSALARVDVTVDAVISADSFNLNFYAYGSLSSNDRNAVTLEAGESAGFDAWNTSGWQNISVPWGPSSPQAPIGITSNEGETAVFVFNDVRNGSPYRNHVPHSNLPGDPNGDLMDGHANGTEDPGDQSNLFDITLTEIPFPSYDLIVYLGANAAQYGDGTGKLVLNGGPEMDFTLTAGEFASFERITNADEPGNVLIFRELSGVDLNLKVWGNGFNHIGPAGIQIAVAGMSSIAVTPTPAVLPVPAEGLIGSAVDVDLSWSSGYGAVTHDVYFGTDPTFDHNAFQVNQSATTFDPGILEHGTYYWRVDGKNSDGTTTGDVWSFTVGAPGKATRPMPRHSFNAVSRNPQLHWTAGESATGSMLHFGTSSVLSSDDLVTTQANTTHNPGFLRPDTVYYWRVDSVNERGTTEGDVWSFKTAKNAADTVKVFILAGQSNMEGHGDIGADSMQGTLGYWVNNDPSTFGHLRDGTAWVVRDDVWISYRRNSGLLKRGGLTVGYGANDQRIGPELEFGQVLGNHFDEPVLLIKTAWGGKSLAEDFRPPSLGWSELPAEVGDHGYYFDAMINEVVTLLADLGSVFPAYAGQGFELAGMGWHQGWNDFVEPVRAAAYEENLKNLINDVRAAFGVPMLPFVAATTGLAGGSSYTEFEQNQLKLSDASLHPAFEGNVDVVDSNPFYRTPNQSPANEGHHWNRNAESYFLIGEAMGDAMKTLKLTAPVLSDFEIWKEIHGVTEDHGNEDFDSLVNILEFALGGDPNSAASAPGPWLVENEDMHEFKFQRDQPSLNYTVETSENLSTWIHYTTVTNANGVVGDTATVAFPRSTTSNRKLFIRLKVD